MTNKDEIMDTFVYVHILNQEVRIKVETSILRVEKDTTCRHTQHFTQLVALSDYIRMHITCTRVYHLAMELSM